MAIHQALEEAVESRNRNFKKVLIVTDCLSALQSILHYPTRSLAKQVKRVHSELISEICFLIISLKGQGGQVYFYKVKSHEGIFGNEVANMLAELTTDPEWNEPTQDMVPSSFPLNALAVTYGKKGRWFSRPPHKIITALVTEVVCQDLRQHNSGSAAQPADSEPLASLMDPTLFAALANFIYKVRCNRLRLPVRAHTPPFTQDCPICHHHCRLDRTHFLLECTCSTDARNTAIYLLEKYDDNAVEREKFKMTQGVLAALRTQTLVDNGPGIEEVARYLMGAISYQGTPRSLPPDEDHQRSVIRPIFRAIAAAYHRAWAPLKGALYS